MVIVGVILYVVLFSAAMAFIVLPHWRGEVLTPLRSGCKKSVQGLLGTVKSASFGLYRTIGTGVGLAPHLHRWVRRHAASAAACAGILLGLPLAAVLMRATHAFDAFDPNAGQAVNAQVAALLMGEQLVPPAALPPELFLTREVEQAHPWAATASRQWELLDDDFRRRLLVVFELMRQQGHEMVLIEGYRSPQRQAQLAALGPTVTQAGAGMSYHQYGLAADVAFLVDGRIVASERHPAAARGYERLGAVAPTAGLTWGGGWRNLRDLGHLELTRPGVLRQPDAAAD